ncbi:uncharacterized protein [Lolium perenne]|uniref:uncharacterized protein isoform X2 n=1 Tax=Lolium perenne TaxID=4522 RepID=UPI003A99F73A
MNVEWSNKAVVMKYLFKYVTKGSEMMLLQAPQSVTKPPGPSDGKGEIGSQVERAMFTETSPEQPEEVLDPQVQSKELGLPASDAPDSPPAPSAAPLVDRRKQPQTRADAAGKKKKA